MQKIPTLFLRDEANMARVTREVNPEAAWVLAGEGTPTRKRDGTNVRIDVWRAKRGVYDAALEVWKRRNPTREEKAAGAEPGYILARREDPADKHIFAAVRETDFADWPEGQWPCEALGPKIQGGVESDVPCLYAFSLWPERLPEFPRTFDGIRDFLEANEIEGIVWQRENGDMSKVKRRDFSLPWPVKR